MKPVVIVGNLIREAFPYEKSTEEADYWSFNAGAMSKRKLTAAFQMHDEPRYVCNGDKYMEWLRNAPVPVYMREQHDEFPTSIAYPLDEILEMQKIVMVGQVQKPLKYLTSTSAYALALAVLQKRPQIDIYGVELTTAFMIARDPRAEKEYKNQREGFAWWVGFAAGRGIPINIHGAEDIFRKPLYGLGLEKA